MMRQWASTCAMDFNRLEPLAAHAVVVDVNCRRFGLSLASVIEVIRIESDLPSDVIPRRGVDIPIIDLRKALGEPDRVHGMGSRILVVRTPRGQMGLVVDSISSVLTGNSSESIPASRSWEWLDPLLVIPRIED